MESSSGSGLVDVKLVPSALDGNRHDGVPESGVGRCVNLMVDWGGGGSILRGGGLTWQAVQSKEIRAFTALHLDNAAFCCIA